MCLHSGPLFERPARWSSPERCIPVIVSGSRSPRAALSIFLLGGAILAAACADAVTQIDEADISELRVSPESVSIGPGETVALLAYPLDETGAFLSGLDVSWSSMNPSVATVDDTGLVAGVSVGSAEIVASVGTLQASVSVSVLVPADIVLSADTLTYAVVAGEAAPPDQVIEVTNGGELPLTGLMIDSIVYVGVATGWALPSLTSTLAPTDLTVGVDPTGVTTVGEYVARVSLSGATDGPEIVTVVLTVEAADASVVTLNEGDGQTATVGAALPVSPSVRVTDAFGNPVEGEAVTFSVTEGGGSTTGAAAVTDAAGLAAVGSWTLGTTLGENRLDASIGAGASVTFTATASAGGPASLTLNAGDGQTAIAGQAVVVPPSVEVRDAFGNLVEGATVTFTVTAGGGSVTGSPATADGSGLAAVGSWVLGPTVGLNTLIATATGVADTVTFSATSVAGAAAQMLLDSGDAQTDTVGATLGAPYAVLIADVNGNPVSGVTVSWAVTAGGGSIGGLSTSDGGGIAVATHTLGQTAGSQSVEASVSGLSGSPVTFTSTASAASPSGLSIVQGAGQTATVDSEVATSPAVQVVDGFGNTASGIDVTYRVVSGGGTVSGSVATSDGSGLATVGGWTLGQTAGANALRAVIVGVDSVEFTATGEAGAATALLLEAGDGQGAAVGTTVAISPAVRVTDSFGNRVTGTSVTFTVTSGGGSVTGSPANSDASGVATAGSWVLGPAAGANTLEATSVGISGSVVFTATALAGAPTSLEYVSGDAQTATAGTTLAVDYAVRLLDGGGNPVPGVPVSWSVSGGGSITATSSSDASGIAVATRVLGTTAGTQTASASFGGLTPVEFTATATAGAAAQIAAVPGGDGQSATVATAVSTPPAVLVEDQYGNPVAGELVTFAVPFGDGTVDPGTAVATNASGIAAVTSWTLGTLAGPDSLTATAGSGGVTGSPVTFTATATAGAASQLVLSAGNGQSAVAGSPVSVEPAVSVEDQYGNPVAGASVAFTVTSGGGSVTGSPATSSGSGVATVGSWTLGSTAGSNTLEATSAGVVGSVVFTATGTAGSAATIALDGGDGQNGTVGATLGTAYSVLVTDTNGNPVSGVTVTWSVGGGGSITPSSDTNASGIAVATRALGTTAGTQTASAAVMGLAGSPVTFTATATAGAPALITGASLDSLNLTALTDSVVPSDPTVTVTDVYGNPTAATVLFSANNGGSVGSASVATATGTASTSWTVVVGSAALRGNGTFENTLTATIDGVPGESATFTGYANYSFAESVNPIFSANGCLGCHGGLSGLTLSTDAATSHSALVNVVPTCDGSLAANVRRVSPLGTPDAANLYSILFDFVTGRAQGNCDGGGFDMTVPPADTAIIRAWIQNGAPNN